MLSNRAHLYRQAPLVPHVQQAKQVQEALL